MKRIENKESKWRRGNGREGREEEKEKGQEKGKDARCI